MEKAKNAQLNLLCKIIGTAKIAEACGISQRGVYRWLESGGLPRTCYTGESNYHEKISELSGGNLTPSEVKELGRRQQ